MKKFALIAMVLVLATGMMFAGGTKEAKSASPSAVPAAKEVTITWWNFPNFGEDGAFEREIIAAFEAKNPGIKVKLEMLSYADGEAKLNTAIASNTAPDMVYDAPGRIIAWGNEGVLAPLDDIIAAEKANLAAGPLATSKGADGKYYMFPVHTLGFSMAFNKEMLEDFGLIDMLPYKTQDRTWTLKQYEDLLRAIKAKLPAGKVPAVFYAKSQAGDQGTRAFMVNLYGNAPLMDGTLKSYTFNSANAVKNAEWLQKAVKDGLLMNGSALIAGDAIDMYCASNAASTILFSPQLETINAAKINYNGKKFTSIYMPFPNDTGKPVLEYIVGGPCVFDNRDAGRIAAAKKLVQFIATDPVYAPKVIEKVKSFPVTSKIPVTLATEELKWNANATKFFGSYYNNIKSFPEMRTFWFPAMQAILNNGNAKTVLDEFVSKANAIK